MPLNKNISLVSNDRKCHSKASEEYLHVKFTYPDTTWEGWVPVVYRRTGLDLRSAEEEVAHLNDVYEKLDPKHLPDWKKNQETFWQDKPRADVTKSFFDALADGNWKCVSCSLPDNPNFARRIQDLKEYGYTIATDTARFCPACNKKSTHLMLLRIPRGNSQGNGYETFPASLRKRILSLLGNVDCYENSHNPHCLPDHKFPEIRWDENTKEENPTSMSDDDIKKKFQLLTNQRNQQKREVCRTCFQTGRRGNLFGLDFYYAGSELWDSSIPQKGKDAEQGCLGCPWYDMQAWREALNNKLRKEE